MEHVLTLAYISSAYNLKDVECSCCNCLCYCLRRTGIYQQLFSGTLYHGAYTVCVHNNVLPRPPLMVTGSVLRLGPLHFGVEGGYWFSVTKGHFYDEKDDIIYKANHPERYGYTFLTLSFRKKTKPIFNKWVNNIYYIF